MSARIDDDSQATRDLLTILAAALPGSATGDPLGAVLRLPEPRARHALALLATVAMREPVVLDVLRGDVVLLDVSTARRRVQPDLDASEPA